jgi:hypothetical protein
VRRQRRATFLAAEPLLKVAFLFAYFFFGEAKKK